MPGQREALHRLAKHQGGQLLSLATHIIEHGGSIPADLPIAIASEEEIGRYILLDGNRRLTAIRALESPDSLGDSLEQAIMEKIRRLSLKYQQAPIETMQCVIVADRDEAQPWIDLRHQGPLGGAGTVHWSPDGKARSIAQAGGKLELHTRLLNFLQDDGHLTIEKRETIPVTTLKRLLGTPAVRERIGIEVEKGGGLRFHPDEQAVIKGLLYIIDDITAGPHPKNVNDVRHVEDRIEYAKKLPLDKIPQPTFQGGVAVGTTTPPGAPKPAKQAPLLRGRKERATLIPADCRLRITERRIERIAIELRKLALVDYPNAIAVLCRVFIEHSADYYLVNSMHRTKASLLGPGMTLSRKLTDIVANLEQNNILSRQEAAPVKSYCQKNSFLAPSVLTMNDYVHNFHLNPTPTDLRAAWDGFEIFLKKIWA